MSLFNSNKLSSANGNKTINTMLFSNNSAGSFNRIYKFDSTILSNIAPQNSSTTISKPAVTSSSITNSIKLQFSIENLVNYAYEHAPVTSMSGKPPLREIITIEPLQNLNYSGPDSQTYILTYIYYNSEQTNGNPLINGYGYLTYPTHNSTSVRSVFTVTSNTSEILSRHLFYPEEEFDSTVLNNGQPENVFMYNNETGETVPLTLSINNGIVTIESQ
jgi:hypothetical protein